MTVYTDYLRVAAWDDPPSGHLLTGKLRERFQNWQSSRWLQYSGYRAKQAFYGIAAINGRRHSVWHVSGPLSGFLFDTSSICPDVYGTRVDIQKTVVRPDWYNPSQVYRAVKSHGKLKTSLILSETGGTVYIGSRNSDIMVRLYEKPIPELNQVGLRLEFEIKGRMARTAYGHLMTQKFTKSQLFDYWLQRPTGLPPAVYALFVEGAESIDNLPTLEKEADIAKKLEWLSSLTNAVHELGNDHDAGPMVKALLESWLEAIAVPN